MKSIKQQAIESYDKKIAWMKKQPPNKKPDVYDMKIKIGIGWDASYCSYCNKYFVKYCEKCKLNPTKEYASSGNVICCNGLYNKMIKAKTYRICIKYAKLIRQYIIDNG